MNWIKLERWLLAPVLHRPSTDSDALALAQGRMSDLAAWHVEARDTAQALLAAGRTRWWLMALPQAAGPGESARLCARL